MTPQYDSSILPTEADQNAHDIRQCHHCLENMTEEDIALDCNEQDCLCADCRRKAQDGYEL